MERKGYRYIYYSVSSAVQICTFTLVEFLCAFICLLIAFFCMVFRYERKLKTLFLEVVFFIDTERVEILLTL